MIPQRGCTLIELAIVLVIMTILIGGLAMPLSAQIQARRIAETKKTLEEAREAIIGYAMGRPASSSTCTCTYTIGDTGTCPVALSSVTPSACASLCPSAGNVELTLPSCPTPGTGPLTLTLPIARHYLPCPNVNGDGQEGPRDAGRCLNTEGFFPWVALGTASQDAWGNRLRYAVTDAFSNSTGFSNSDEGDLKVCNSSANAGANDCTTGNVADKVPVVVLSHGPNGWGALNVSGKTLASVGGNGEKENYNTDAEFVSSPPYKPANGSAAEQAKEFDDLVVWISDGLLKSRVCPSGGCPP